MVQSSPLSAVVFHSGTRKNSKQLRGLGSQCKIRITCGGTDEGFFCCCDRFVVVCLLSSFFVAVGLGRTDRGSRVFLTFLASWTTKWQGKHSLVETTTGRFFCHCYGKGRGTTKGSANKIKK